jgi:hypothetical protein
MKAFLCMAILCASFPSLGADSPPKAAVSGAEGVPAENASTPDVIGRWWIKDPSRICAIQLRGDGTITRGNAAAGKWNLNPGGDKPLLTLTWDNGSTESAAMVATDHFQGKDDSDNTIDLRRDAIPGPQGAGDVKPTTAALRLEHQLSGTTWEWGWDGPNSASSIKFLPDGTIECPDWTARGLVTGWEAKSGDAVRLTILAGRNYQLFAYLIFSEDHTSYIGTAFDDKILAISHEVK